MAIRSFDFWIHEQDIRVPLRRPGHTSGPAAELALDEVRRSFGYIVGKRAGIPDGSSVCSSSCTGRSKANLQRSSTDAPAYWTTSTTLTPSSEPTHSPSCCWPVEGPTPKPTCATATSSSEVTQNLPVNSPATSDSLLNASKNFASVLQRKRCKLVRATWPVDVPAQRYRQGISPLQLAALPAALLRRGSGQRLVNVQHDEPGELSGRSNDPESTEPGVDLDLPVAAAPQRRGPRFQASDTQPASQTTVIRERQHGLVLPSGLNRRPQSRPRTSPRDRQD